MHASTEPAHWLLILNGKSADEDGLRQAIQDVRDSGIRLEVRVTWEQGDAERYVREGLQQHAHTVIAAGGDGTLSEVAAALARAQTPAPALPSLGLVPLGTANDFAAAAQIPAECAHAFELIRLGPACAIDLLRIDCDDSTHWCANLASGGFGTDVTVETNEVLKKLFGGLAYVLTGLSKLHDIEPQRARFEGPDFSWEGDFIALGIGNGRQAGGGQQLCPEAYIDDALLELTIVPPLRGEVLNTLGAVLSEGTQAALERVAVRVRLPWLRISAPAPLTLNLDGEPLTAQRFDIACGGGLVRMHLPPGCPLLRVPGTPLPHAVPVQGGEDLGPPLAVLPA